MQAHELAAQGPVGDLQRAAEQNPYDARAFRQAMGRFATGVVIVTASEENGRPVGLTLNSFNAVSLAPPLILFSVARSARSLDHLVRAQAFVANVLHRGQEALSDQFASSTSSKWEGVDYESGLEGAPLISGALAHFECAPYARHDGGDHIIFLGEVRKFRASVDESPLIYYRGRYRDLGG
ncbi:flavin reductase family protein [Terrarubrum flagellatum]|uniref:flavin reductase family protein n=1 Tax=Terrirubrum flagellatum TaxID=2895980 RepID=UPI003144F452